MFPVVVQVLLTIAGGSAALTEKGRNWLRSQMTRLRIPSHFRQEFGAVAALLILLIVGSIHQFYLPQLAVNRYSAGLDHYQAGQFDSALQSYQQTIAIRPDQVAVHYHLGLLYEDLQRTDEAIAEYQLVTSQDPEELDQLIWLRAHNKSGSALYLKWRIPQSLGLWSERLMPWKRKVPTRQTCSRTVQPA
jgi:tetratricopeptide (TPR) repeat protein